MPDRYIQPNWFTRNIFNRIVAWLTQLGISVYGSRVLAVKGRRTGAWHTIPVNLLEYRAERYLVAPRGVTQWVRNVRAGSEAELRLGARRERVKLLEVPDNEPLKIELLRTYLRDGHGKSAPFSKAWMPMPPRKSSDGSPRTTLSFASSPRPSSSPGFDQRVTGAAIWIGPLMLAPSHVTVTVAVPG